MVSRWSRVKAGCAFALACVLPCAFTPGAFAADDGRWPVVNDTVASAWKQGIDGSGVKVAVLDTQAVEDYPALKDADITYRLGRFSGMGGNECCRKDSPCSTRAATRSSARWAAGR